MAKFVLKQEGEIIAVVECDNREDALREVGHYTYLYLSNGPVQVQEVRRRRSPQDTSAND